MHRLMCGFVVVLLAAVAGTSVAASTYLVGYGDTLWDISIRFYGSPDYWDDILAANPQLPAPEALSPGMEIVLPDLTGVQLSSTGYELTTTVEAPTLAATVPMLSRLRIESTGFVAQSALDPTGYIVGVNIEDTAIPSSADALPGDLIEIDAGSDEGLMEGQLFTILEIGEDAIDPENSESMGSIVRVAGLCSIVGTTPQTSIALIDHCYRQVNVGDALIPYASAQAIPLNPAPVVEDLYAWVVGIQDPDVINAYCFDTVYLNKGWDDGVHPGDVFQAFKQGSTVESVSGEQVLTADLPIAEMVIVSTQPGTSSALVTHNLAADLIQVGDQVYLSRRQGAGSSR
jgi:hypothetical protein